MVKGESYEEFMAKFQNTAKNTDDCYTPKEVYNVILNWVVKRYNLGDDVQIIRPFYPGGDYENEDYPENCVVVDNPPFSMSKKINQFYHDRGIRYFLFAQCATVFNACPEGDSVVYASHHIKYDNGARIATAFVTNLERGHIVLSPALSDAIHRFTSKNRADSSIPRKVYRPPNLVSSISFQKYVRFCKNDTTIPFHGGVPSTIEDFVFGGSTIVSDATLNWLTSISANENKERSKDFNEVLYLKELERINECDNGVIDTPDLTPNINDKPAPRQCKLDEFFD